MVTVAQIQMRYVISLQIPYLIFGLSVTVISRMLYSPSGSRLFVEFFGTMSMLFSLFLEDG